MKLHSYLMIIVLIKRYMVSQLPTDTTTCSALTSIGFLFYCFSLSAVARKRPAFYGRILPVLLGLDPSRSVSKGMHLAGVHHALKNAFESCLNCTHPGAAPVCYFNSSCSKTSCCMSLYVLSFPFFPFLMSSQLLFCLLSYWLFYTYHASVAYMPFSFNLLFNNPREV